MMMVMRPGADGDGLLDRGQRLLLPPQVTQPVAQIDQSVGLLAIVC